MRNKVLLIIVIFLLFTTLLLSSCAKKVTTAQESALVDSVEELNGKKAGVQIGTTGELAAKEIKGLTVNTYDDILLAFEDLKAGRIDAVICDSYVGYSYAKSNKGLKVAFVIPTNEELGIAFAKDTPELLKAVNGALQSMFDDGTYDTIYEKWFGEKTVTMETKKVDILPPPTIKPGILTVGSDATWPPMEYVEGDKIIGFDVDMAQAIADRLNLKLNYQNTAWDGLFPALIAHKFDMAISSITITDERKQEMDFSISYYKTDQAVTIRE